MILLLNDVEWIGPDGNSHCMPHVRLAESVSELYFGSVVDVRIGGIQIV